MRKGFLENYRRDPSIFDLMSDLESLFAAPTRATQPGEGTTGWRPPVDVEENEYAYLLSFDLPGVKKEDIKIDLNDRRLTVSGVRLKANRGTDEANRLHQYERFHGEFQRSFVLPETVALDKIEANYSEGILELVVPKSEETRPRSISINSGRSKFFDKLLGSRKASEAKETH